MRKMKVRRIPFQPDRVKSILKEKKCTIKKMGQDLSTKGFSYDSLKQAMKTKMIMPDYLDLIAEYIDCDQDYLIGFSEERLPFRSDYWHFANEMEQMDICLSAFTEFLKTTPFNESGEIGEYAKTMMEVYDTVSSAFQRYGMPYPIIEGLYEEVMRFIHMKFKTSKQILKLANEATENGDYEALMQIKSQLFIPYDPEEQPLPRIEKKKGGKGK